MADDYNVMDDLDEILDKVTADRVRDMRHGDGVLTSGKESYKSVLQRLATSIGDTDKEYRQALLLASFLSPDEADRATAAIAECKRYGVSIAPIVDRIIARCGVKGSTWRVGNIVEALTHQHVTANTPEAFKKMMDARNKGKRGALEG